MSSRVAVVVPNWNGVATLRDCLTSLTQQTLPVDIIVVDNGSTDGSTTMVTESFTDVTLLAQPKNLGFAGGVNVGIRHALEHYPYIGLFNNDAVADINWAASLVGTLDAHPKSGIATGLLLSRDGTTIDSTGEQYSIWGLPFPRQRGTATADALPAGETFGASGGASIYRSELFKEIGVFDETFFAYYEDTDISFRARLAGYSVLYEPAGIAFHAHGTTSGKLPGFTVYQTFKNLPLLFIKSVPLALLPRVGSRFALAYVLIFANAVRKGNLSSALKGVVKCATLLPHAFRERAKVARLRKISVHDVALLFWPDLPPDQHGIRSLRKQVIGR